MTKGKSNDFKAVKCYYCGNLITRSHDLVIKKVPMNTKRGIRNYNRKLHLDCVSKYNEGLEDEELRIEENDDWDKVYRYFRKEILRYNDSTKLQEHTVKRLLGLRLGQYYPSGNNTRILPRGYSFSTILICLKLVKPKIQFYLATTDFKNEKHMIDGIMRFVTSEISDVARRIERQKEANKKLENPDQSSTSNFDYKEAYKKISNKKDNEDGIANDIESLLGGSL